MPASWRTTAGPVDAGQAFRANEESSRSYRQPDMRQPFSTSSVASVRSRNHRGNVIPAHGMIMKPSHMSTDANRDAVEHDAKE